MQLGMPGVADWRILDQPIFTCPICHARSTHPEDIANGYCGRCHAFTGSSEEIWVDEYDCGHEETVVVFVLMGREARVGDSAVCKACSRVVTVVRTKRR